MARRTLTEKEINYILEGDESEEDEDQIDDESEYEDLLRIIQRQIDGFEDERELQDELELAEHIEPRIATEEQAVEDLEEDMYAGAGPSRLRWYKSTYIPDDVTCVPEDNEFLDDELTPFEYFKMFFDNDIMENIVFQSNLYAVQKDPERPLNTTKNEVSAFMGILLLSGIIKVPSYRMYWANATRVSSVAEVMPRNKFEQIKWKLHFNDNAKMKQRTEPGYDKLFKLRPLVDAIRANCLKLKPEEHNAVDEVLIPCKSRSSMIQYIKSKPHKWGVKLFARCSSAGILYDFKIYTGKDPNVTPSNLGVSGDAVTNLCEHLPKHQNFKVYTDNWFSSYKLTVALKEMGIFTTGCVRNNRLPGCRFEDDRTLKKKGRGSYDYRVEKSSNIVALKWFDSKPIHMVSSFVGVEEVSQVQRWSLSEKRTLAIPRPNIITMYNKHMGGVDLSDMLVALYRTDMGTKRFYMRVFYYFLDVSVVNSWLLYRKHCSKLGLAKNRVKKLVQFRSEIAQVLLLQTNYALLPRRGRPTASPASSVSSSTSRTPVRRPRALPPPLDIVRQHGGHLPEHTSQRRRCFHCKDRNSTSRIICIQCKQAFCITRKKQCFRDFHKNA